MIRNVTTLKVKLPNGEDRLVIKSPDYETKDDYIYSPKKLDGSGYGICCDSVENAIKFMVQWECNHEIINNDAVSEHKNFTPLPYKCTKCNKHFYTKPQTV